MFLGIMIGILIGVGITFIVVMNTIAKGNFELKNKNLNGSFCRNDLMDKLLRNIEDSMIEYFYSYHGPKTVKQMMEDGDLPDYYYQLLKLRDKN